MIATPRFHAFAALTALPLLLVAVPARAQGDKPQEGAPAEPQGGAPAQPPAGTAAPAEGAGAATEKKPEPKWYDIINVGAFVDTYASINYKARPSSGVNKIRAFDINNGLSLAWAGVDTTIDPDPVGVNIGLRFGPSVAAMAVNDANAPGVIGNLQNAYVAWKPGGKSAPLTLIAGKFDTLYGQEVVLSQQNINYTRSALYALGQPIFHTGVRADYQASDLIALKVIAVNGWNRTVDNNTGKTFGAQIALTPSDKISISAGYLGGPEQDDQLAVICTANTAPDPNTGSCVPSPGSAGGGKINQRVTGANSRWRHLGDIVVDAKLTPELRIAANASYVAESVQGASGADETIRWWGAELIGRYQFTDVFAAALRGEYFDDEDGYATTGGRAPQTIITTGTLTLEAAVHKYLLVRLDQRIDAADQAIFVDGLNGTSKTQITTTVGIVGHTN